MKKIQLVVLVVVLLGLPDNCVAIQGRKPQYIPRPCGQFDLNSWDYDHFRWYWLSPDPMKLKQPPVKGRPRFDIIETLAIT